MRAEERLHVRGEALARLVTDIEHVPARIELELRPFRLREGRQVIEHVTACHVRGHQIGIAVGHDQPEGRVESEENTEVVADARLTAATFAPAAALPNKSTLRVSQFYFSADFELNPDQPLFRELGDLREQVFRELQLPPSNTVVLVYLFEDRDRYDRFMKARYPDLPRRRAFFVAQPRTVGGGDELLVYTFWGERVRPGERCRGIGARGKDQSRIVAHGAGAVRSCRQAVGHAPCPLLAWLPAVRCGAAARPGVSPTY